MATKLARSGGEGKAQGVTLVGWLAAAIFLESERSALTQVSHTIHSRHRIGLAQPL